jgi:Ca2+-binding RTX toxin-like protein
VTRSLALLAVLAAVCTGTLGAARGADAGADQKVRPLCLGKRATIVGNAQANVLTGTRRSDVIVGLGGKDTIMGAGGTDLICGGAGNDVLVGGAGRDALDGGAGRDTCRTGERLVRCEETRLELQVGPLAPGTYVTGVFTPRFGFTVPSGWSASFAEEPRQVILARKRDPGGLSVTFDSFARAQSVETTIARLAGIEGVLASNRGAAEIGGSTGQRVDLLVTADDLVLVPGLADRYELEPNDRLRAYALPIGGATVSIFVEAPAADFDSFLRQAEDLLGSLRWG